MQFNEEEREVLLAALKSYAPPRPNGITYAGQINDERRAIRIAKELHDRIRIQT